MSVAVACRRVLCRWLPHALPLARRTRRGAGHTLRNRLCGRYPGKFATFVSGAPPAVILRLVRFCASETKLRPKQAHEV